MADPRKTLNIGKFLSIQGLKVVGMDEDGTPMVQPPKGEPKRLKLDSVTQAMGNPDLSQFDLKFNEPDDALAQSPVSLMDRLKLTTSTETRSLPFLKKRFEDAIVHPDNGVLVKHRGAWHQVDPSGLGSGSAWDKSKEFAKDVVDVADEIAGSLFEGAGATAGGLMGMFAGGATAPVTGPLAPALVAAGGYAGAIAGAAGAAKGVARARFRLGKMLGTYSATEQEQDQDEALEMIYAASGQAVLPIAGGALKLLGRGIKNTPKVLLGLQAKLIGTEVDNLYRVADRPKEVETAVKAAWGMARAKAGDRATSEMAQAAAMSVQKNTVGTILDEASAELPRRYTKIVAETAAEAGDEFTAPIGKAATGILDALSTGETPFLRKIALKQTPAEIAQGVAPRFKYRPLKDSEVLSRGGQTFFDQQSFNRFVRQVGGLTKMKDLHGAEAVQAIAKIKKGINEVLRYPAQNAPAAELQKIARLGAIADEHLDNLFGAKDAPLRKLWESKAEPYRRYANAVNWGRRTMQDETGRALETFTKQVASNKAGKGMAAKEAIGMPSSFADDEAGPLIELLGARGQELATRVSDYEAARALTPVAPRLGIAQGLGAGMALTGPLGLGAKAALLTGTLGQSSPALARKEIQGAAWVRSKTAKAVAPFTDLLKGISKARGESGVMQALTNDKFVQQLTASMAKSLQMEHNREAFAQQILDYKMRQEGGDGEEQQ